MAAFRLKLVHIEQSADGQSEQRSYNNTGADGLNEVEITFDQATPRTARKTTCSIAGSKVNSEDMKVALPLRFQLGEPLAPAPEGPMAPMAIWFRATQGNLVTVKLYHEDPTSGFVLLTASKQER